MTYACAQCEAGMRPPDILAVLVDNLGVDDVGYDLHRFCSWRCLEAFARRRADLAEREAPGGR